MTCSVLCFYCCVVALWCACWNLSQTQLAVWHVRNGTFSASRVVGNVYVGTRRTMAARVRGPTRSAGVVGIFRSRSPACWSGLAGIVPGQHVLQLRRV